MRSVAASCMHDAWIGKRGTQRLERRRWGASGVCDDWGSDLLRDGSFQVFSVCLREPDTSGGGEWYHRCIRGGAAHVAATGAAGFGWERLAFKIQLSESAKEAVS